MLGIEFAERVRITESEGTEHEDRSKEEDACKRGRRERERERRRKTNKRGEKRGCLGRGYLIKPLLQSPNNGERESKILLLF